MYSRHHVYAGLQKCYTFAILGNTLYFLSTWVVDILHSINMQYKMWYLSYRGSWMSLLSYDSMSTYVGNFLCKHQDVNYDTMSHKNISPGITLNIFRIVYLEYTIYTHCKNVLVISYEMKIIINSLQTLRCYAKNKSDFWFAW